MIAIRHIELTGGGDEFYPLGGDADICVTLDRSGDTTIEVPATLCLRGKVAGTLTLTGKGNVTSCGDLEVQGDPDISALAGTFTPGNGLLLVRYVYGDHFYVAKLYVQSNAAITGVEVSEMRIIQDARQL
jgi:hypothetical protein